MNDLNTPTSFKPEIAITMRVCHLSQFSELEQALQALDFDVSDSYTADPDRALYDNLSLMCSSSHIYESTSVVCDRTIDMSCSNDKAFFKRNTHSNLSPNKHCVLPYISIIKVKSRFRADYESPETLGSRCL